MQSNLAVFPEHLARACRLRKVTQDPSCAAAVDLHLAGLRALDIYRLAQIADKLDVSVDWLLGRSDIMELRETKAKKRGPSARAAFLAHSRREADCLKGN
jgi:hypothetical protein